MTSVVLRTPHTTLDSSGRRVVMALIVDADAASDAGDLFLVYQSRSAAGYPASRFDGACGHSSTAKAVSFTVNWSD
jgi:hypothetical protein